MKSRQLFWSALCAMLFLCVQLIANDDETNEPPQRKLSEVLAAIPKDAKHARLYEGPYSDDIVFNKSDYAPVAPGQLRTNHWKDIHTQYDIIISLLHHAPDDTTGKLSPWFDVTVEFKQRYEKCLTTRAQTDFFEMIPFAVRIVKLDEERDHVAEEFAYIAANVAQLDHHFVRAIGDYVEQQNGEIPADYLKYFVQLYSCAELSNLQTFSDGKVPFYSAGLMIIDADAVVTQLRAAPWEQAATYLRRSSNPAQFFLTYRPDGSGHEALRKKYAANKDVINMKFRELKSWMDIQRKLAASQAQ